MSLVIESERLAFRSRTDSTGAFGTHASGVWWRLAGSFQKSRLPMVLLLLLMTAGACGLPRLKTSIRIETLFPAHSRIMQDYLWLEEHPGPLVPIEVLVTFHRDCSLNDRQRMELLYEIDLSLNRVPSLAKTTSALTFFPPFPTERNLPRMMKITALNRAIMLAKPEFELGGMLRMREDGEHWRLTCRV